MPRFLLLALLSLLIRVDAVAAPYVPASDEQVLEKLPLRRADPRAAELNALQQALRRQPGDAERAVALAGRYFELVMAEGDPRYIGYAQAALAPWWKQPDPPPRVRVVRAMLNQFDHRFAEAIADLRAAVAADPADAQAWAWLAAIHMVQADYPQARQACERLAPHTSPLLAITCSAYVDSVTGRAAAAAAGIRAALQEHAGAPAAERLWAWTRLAEIDERLGAHAAADADFRAALALGVADSYLLAAYADFLLDRGRAAEVLRLLDGQARADVLLLRLALAAKALNAPALAGYQRDLQARFDAARLRGDTTHLKEEARFVLALKNDAQRALTLARDNFALQREPADARVLLEAALAARQPEGAAPALRWLAESGIESVALRGLAQQLSPLR